MAKTEREKIVIYFEKPESWWGVIDLPAGFSEMDYDTQNDIIQKLVDTRQLRDITIDYWDYSE